MKIGVLELLSEDANRSFEKMPHDFLVVKQYASIMPQAVSVWCRNLGHDVFYATYYGQKDPIKLIPSDLEVIFISCFSRGSGLAYALAKLIKKQTPGILTIIGGPHAKQFSFDALRFFDVVVKDCDQILVKEILSDFPRKKIVTSPRRLKDIPGIKERLPEIRIASFWNKKPSRFSFIPILASTGCPYSCDFCVDWNTPYNPLPLERVEEDLLFAAKYFPQIRINFYDPNFGVKFDEIMTVIERVPHPRKRWFLTEGSLNSLTKDRLNRMKKAGCLCVIPGIESWDAYSRKAGITRVDSARDKLNEIIDKFELIHQYIPIIQANLMFGLDTDNGRDPVLLNKEFISRTPYVSHSLNIPAPFGQTPLFERYLSQARILTALPFTFYCKPYLATTIKNYSPIDFYENLIETFSHMTSPAMQFAALKTTKNWIFKGYHPIRNISLRLMIRTMRQVLNLLKTDHHFRAFHQGDTIALPDYYHHQYEALLGPYKDLVSREDRIPLLETTALVHQEFKKTGT
ncbi:MAG: radical SAM protein [Proteobacteria bacterium]|nr:radical SAM protein [Pseudomonadota bacterium]MBU1581976.1 radical SAM protein [Pseudomonadota bacterium]MBU2455885.1 radical SAM protein [Pseudomonadota bacterium]MBU2627292.1 radical SAM protein [Pseudomonadota bacterium]